MSGGVLLLDYDRDGWLDLYFTNSPTVCRRAAREKGAQARYTTTIMTARSRMSTEKAGIGTPCYGEGGSVADYNNDGWPDIYVTCFGGNVLYRNNGDGTFTDVSKQAGVADGRWSTGSACGGL